MPDLDGSIEQLFRQLAAQQLPAPSAAAVASRGRQRRRRARARTVSAAALAVVVIAAVTASRLSATPAHHRPPTGHGHHTAVSRPLACPAAASAALSAELQARLPVSTQSGVTPIAISRSGTALYVLTTTEGFRGIAEENLRTGAILAKIEQLPANYTGVQGGVGAGGPLVWSSTYNDGALIAPMTPVSMWSPTTGQVRTLEPAGQHGGALSAPVVFGNAAAWEQADGSQQEIVEANLHTARTYVVARGRLGPPVVVGNALVWSASSRADGASPHLVAVTAGQFPAGQPIPVPPSLRSASEAVATRFGPTSPWQPVAALIASYGDATAYFSPDLTALYFSPSPSQPARLVARLSGPGGTGTPGGLIIGPGYIGWSTDSAESYLASTLGLVSNSAASARVPMVQVVNGSTAWGGVHGFGGDILVWTFRPTKKQHLDQFHLVTGSTIHTLRCAAR